MFPTVKAVLKSISEIIDILLARLHNYCTNPINGDNIITTLSLIFAVYFFVVLLRRNIKQGSVILALLVVLNIAVVTVVPYAFNALSSRDKVLIWQQHIQSTTNQVKNDANSLSNEGGHLKEGVQADIDASNTEEGGFKIDELQENSIKE